jgi:hypothetical protein
LETFRFVHGRLKLSQDKDDPIFLIFLLRLVHGHFDMTDEIGEGSINAGIAIVVPVESILATIAEYEKNTVTGGKPPPERLAT